MRGSVQWDKASRSNWPSWPGPEDLPGTAQRVVRQASSAPRLPGICAGRRHLGRDPPRPTGPFDLAPLPDRRGTGPQAGASSGARPANPYRRCHGPAAVPHARGHCAIRDGTAGRAAEGRDSERTSAGRALRPDQDLNQPAEHRTAEPPSARGVIKTLMTDYGLSKASVYRYLSETPPARQPRPGRAWNIPFRGVMQKTPAPDTAVVRERTAGQVDGGAWPPGWVGWGGGTLSSRRSRTTGLSLSLSQSNVLS